MKLPSCSNLIKAAWIGTILVTGPIAISACDEGGMDEVGEEIDDTVDDAVDEAEDEL